MDWAQRNSARRQAVVWLGLLSSTSAIAFACSAWHGLTCRAAPEPYLDEVFHIGQAQAYCAGRFDQWDPKITTPPGLYLISYALSRVGECDVRALRATNCIALCVTAFVCGLVLHAIKERRGTSTATDPIQSILRSIHAVVNISFFPPMFFFTGLYYTDVASTGVTLLAYYYFIRSKSAAFEASSVAFNFVFTATGLFSLLFRQTNVFWVAVFPAGLAIVSTLKSSRRGLKPIAIPQSAPFGAVARASWTYNVLYDVPVSDASIEDYLKVVESIVIVALRKLPAVLRSIIAPSIVLAAFGAFVVWNGGVVLGDKSNHVATIHLPQMLYLWPYILFFSFPLCIGPIFSIVAQLPFPQMARFQRATQGCAIRHLPRAAVLGIFTLLGLLAVHYNTIIHPFTLADNRHYVFYVFRVLRRHWTIPYVMVPVYVLCGWFATRTLGGDESAPPVEKKDDDAAAENAARDQIVVQDQGCYVSFVVVWLAATTLSVVTAPLVEPRYFILPWLMWRLHVPTARTVVEENPGGKGKERREESWFEVLKSSLWVEYDRRLWVETAWHLCVNMVTGFVFLQKGFSWPQEPGKVQRFMW
ncbi:DIE2/ALG10 family-domain-containing protein [Lineolata rhizophorae]|uniref:Dol-P-Glc:Glc(2)Man(9)GlcNAc(2)-PP-Dol alpha-1,2-glucosyltransferase n=1 Tax=Lineolata rhizophorae TaxID=578093 RepID=A0A6A6PCV0_9PEZI|nr:DIE2/ALG10 family-domain-containing protein [Lineolata rhizophorae]